MNESEFLAEFWDEVNTEGPSGFYSFETFVNKVLAHHARIEKKKFSVPIIKGSGLNAIAPNGLLGFQGYLIIIIENRISAEIVEKAIDRNLKSAFTSLAQPKNKTLLFISSKPVRRTIIERFIGKYSSGGDSLNINIWGPRKVDELIMKYIDSSMEIFKNILSLQMPDW